MNLQALKYLVALAEQRHFGKAAAACFVTQPTLSMQIKKLEIELGLQLLERTNKTVMLTAVGAVMAEHASRILAEVNAMRELACLAKDPASGSIQLGIIPTLAPYLLPAVMPQLGQTFPKLRYYLVEEPTQRLLAKLQQGKLDAVIVALPVTDGDWASELLFTETFVLAVPLQHPYARQSTVCSQDLRAQQLLLLEEGHCLRGQALAFCAQVGAEEVKDFRATSLETVRHMVALGVGLTLMPQLACRASDSIAYVPFSGDPPCRHLGLVWRKTSARAGLLQQLAAQIRQHVPSSTSFSHIVGEGRG